MRLLNQLLIAGLASFSLLVSACDNDPDVNLVSKKDQPLESSQVVAFQPNYPGPFTNSSTGKVDAYYNKDNRTLSYTITWSGLPANPLATSKSVIGRGFGIYGPAGKGFNGALIQSFASFTAATSGTYSGTLFVDNVNIKEEDVLLGRFYIQLPTENANPLSPLYWGTLRGQIVF